jgi:hypothetical protein
MPGRRGEICPQARATHRRQHGHIATKGPDRMKITIELPPQLAAWLPVLVLYLLQR